MPSGRAAWSAFSADPRDPASGDLKATDADRDVAADVLREAYADGRLTRAEYDERSATALGTRTLGAFLPLLVDLLPAGWAPASQDPTADLHAKAVQRYQRDLEDARNGWAFVSVLTLAIWGVTSLASGEWLFFWPVFPIIAMGFGYVGTRATADSRIEKYEAKIAEARRIKRRRKRDLE